MPQLDLYDVPLYNPLHPYHWEYDNLPLQGLITRDQVINDAVDINSQILRDAVGTQGTLANRLAQSIEDDGSLKTDAIDDALHNIAEHEDGSKTLTVDELDVIEGLGYTVSNPVPFVRMLSAERDKLAQVTSGATDITLEVETPSNAHVFETGAIVLAESDTLSWQIVAGNRIKGNLAFPTEAAHRHYYDLEPETSDFQNYEVTSTATPFIDGTLRVYINGVRLSADEQIYVPGALATDTWTLNSFTPDPDNGLFVLSTAITSDDIIRIDFDISLP